MRGAVDFSVGERAISREMALAVQIGVEVGGKKQVKLVRCRRGAGNHKFVIGIRAAFQPPKFPRVKFPAGELGKTGDRLPHYLIGPLRYPSFLFFSLH